MVRYAEDIRVIIVSGMRDGNVHVEWCADKDYARASELAKKRLDLESGRDAASDMGTGLWDLRT